MLTKNYMSYVTPFANDNDAWTPEFWGAEALMVLHEMTVMAPLVYTDYSDMIAGSGDTVNVSRPQKFSANRTAQTDNVTDQDAASANVAVKLNQNMDVSFIIKDEEQSKSITDLLRIYLDPAMEAIALGIDNMIAGEKYNFLANKVGKLGQSLTRATDVAIRTKFNNLKAPTKGRNFVFSPDMEGDLLNIGDFTNANTVGDEGSTLRDGHIGRLFGMEHIMSNNFQPVTDSDVTTGAVNNAAGYAAGSTTITVDGFSAAIAAGSYFTVAGDATPLKVVSTVGGATPTSITFTPALTSAVVDDAVVTVYTPYTVNYAAGYAVDTLSALTVDGRTSAASIGQMISDGTSVYGAWKAPTTTAVTLTRPLENAVADDAVIGVGPAGDYGFAFHREAIALVSRPMALPQASNVDAAVQSMDGLAVRVTMAYDQKARGTRVVIDVLCGVKTLNTSLGIVVLG